MLESFTAGLGRVLERAQIRARLDGSLAVEAIHLVGSLAEEEESRAATLLQRYGLPPSQLLMPHWDWLPLDQASVSQEVGVTGEPLPRSSRRPGDPE